MGRLHLVATPIGNMEDVTLRALRVLRDVRLVAAEDTRTTRKLFARYEIGTRLVSYNDRNRKSRTPEILSALAEGDVALVSEAGTPAISDPGYDLVVAALEAGFEVSPAPGVSAVTAALSASGLPSRRFAYLGFLPRQRGARRAELADAASRGWTLVAFESPHRLAAALEDVLAVLGDRRICVAREVTKLHEEFFRGTVSEAIERFREPRGEFTLVVAGSGEAETPDSVDVDGELRKLAEKGMRAREAVDLVAKQSGMPKRDVYRRWLDIKREE